jgi:amino acid adenylation domain-containing protein
MNEKESEMNATGLEIAVIGMTGRFPGAKDVDEFWSNLVEGRETIAFYGDEELRKNGVSSQLMNNPAYVNTYGWLEDIEFFDSSFFGYTPLEVEIMDPQTRIFHECAHEALENAGYDPFTYQKLIGLYAGAAPSFNWQAMAELSGKNNIMGWFASRNFNDKDFLGTLIAHKLNLKGPAFTLDTACSTSMVAIHLACQGLLSGDCDMALAGAVTVQTLKKEGYLYQEGMIHSPDGHCRAFDANARGSNFGNGAGIVVLKRLDDAAADRDTIYAVIKGSFINNDGIRKAAYTAPSVKGQAEVIRNAYKMAEVNPETIGYVETHGTGTSLGDPVEIEGLKSAFNTRKKQFCRIGSVKSNVGHLQNTSGVTGFIKTVLILKHQLIPPSLFFEKSNPQIDFENSPFIVNTELTEWKPGQYPRRAGVSSFGIGGTNVHAILEEWPGAQSAERTAHGKEHMEQGTWSQGREYQLILLSAKTETALGRMTQNLENHFRKNPGTNTADAAYTLQVGRRVHSHRRMLVCKDREEAVDLLASPASRQVKTLYSGEDRRPIIFMFPGLGSQYVNMGRQLYEKEPLFRKEMDRCFEILKPLMDYDLKEILYPPATCNLHLSPDFNQTEIAQPLVFIFEYALAKLLMHWGIKPHAMIGYSFGEYAAACVAGVLSPEDALTLVAARGKLVRNVPRGVMLSVPLTREELTSILASKHDLSIAIDNGPSCIVGGSPGALHAFEQQIKERKLMCMPVPSSHAFHSHMMEPALKEFTGIVGTLTLNKPNIPYISNVTGDWLKDNEAVNPGYWASHLRKTVRFADGMKKLLKGPSSVFVEIGPGRDLTTLTRKYFEKDKSSNHQTINLVRQSQQNFSDLYYLLDKIGRLWLLGQAIDWSAFYHEEKRMRIPLPTYPFEGNRFWIDAKSLKTGIKPGAESAETRPEKKAGMADWFYIPSWKRTRQYNRKPWKSDEMCNWLVFIDPRGFGAKLADHLKKRQPQVVIVESASTFQKTSQGIFKINPAEDDHYNLLFKELAKMDKVPDQIVHLWGITDNKPLDCESDLEVVTETQNLCYYSLVNTASAVGKLNTGKKIQLSVLTNNMQEVTGGEGHTPQKAVVLGPVKIIPKEFANIRCKSIDIVLPPPGSMQEKKLIASLLEEFRVKTAEPVIAYRDAYRWVQCFEPVRLEKSLQGKSRLKKQGVYLITGGLGEVALIVAEYLAKEVQARLVLTGRTPLPPRQEWNRWLETAEEADKDEVRALQRRIQKVQQLEALGAQVLVAAADITRQDQVQRVITQTVGRFGTINGVIHAAGMIDGAMILRRTREMSKRILAPKVRGTLLLERELKDRPLDFFILFSSITSALATPGQTGYTAANAFLDAYSHYRSSRYEGFSVVINWDRWHNTGMSVAAEALFKQLTGKEPLGGIEPWEGIEAFARILEDELPQVLVSTRDLGVLIEQDRTSNQLLSLKEIEKTPGSRPLQKRPKLDSEYAAPKNETQQKLAGIWSEFFGFEKIGIQDDFFEMGGDSLKGVIVLSRIHKELHVEIPIAEFFDHPTIESLSQYIDGATQHTYFSIESAEKKEYYPLSPAQRRLYYLKQITPTSTVYNEYIGVILEGNIGKARVEETFRRLIKRHDSLRTFFENVGHQPVQRVHAEVQFEIEYYDIGREEGTGILIKDFIRPFDLSGAPLMRAGLIKRDEGGYVLMVDIHHIICDGMSIALLIQDFKAVLENHQPPQLRIQYKDYVEWMNTQVVKDRIAGQEQYWLKRFEGDIPVLNLPADYTRPAEQSFAGKTVEFKIGEKETQGLKALAPEEDATLYMKLLAAFNVFLFKIGGQEDIVVGTPLAGRRHWDLEPVIGMFVNTLPIRNYPNRQKTFRDFLREVKENTLKDFEYQEYPFEELIDKLNVDRDISRNPIFDVMFALQNVAKEWAFSRYKYENKVSKFDLTLQAGESGENLFFTIEYSVKLFKKDTIEGFISYFNRIISSILNDSYRGLGEIEIISAEEKRHILEVFNDTRMEGRQDQLLHELFQDQVEKTPGSIAVIFQDEGERSIASISYRELNRQANLLAHVLGARSVRRDSIVAIITEHSLEMIIGILGILKVGGAYLPIDPEYPQERIQYMLADSDSNILVTTQHLSKQIKFEKEIVYLSDTTNCVPTPSHLHLLPWVNAPVTSLAYIIYTSGTTGRPKGVLVAHQSIVNTLVCRKEEYGFRPEFTSLQLFSYSFDGFITSFFTPVISGAKVVLMTKEGLMDISGIKETLVKHRVTHFISVPTLYRTVINGLDKEDAADLRVITLAGEQLSTDILTVTREKNTGIEISNEYGVTEVSVMSTIFRHQEQKSPISIGKPVWNTKIFILDKQFLLLPIGLPGELCIGGEGVSRGYVNNPDLTEEKFQRTVNRHLSFIIGSSPRLSKFSNDQCPMTNDRLYRTGDLARWLSDGNIEFLGRMDQQVKIRGFRIELEEIENLLQTHGRVNEAVVTVGGHKENRYLCAYFTTKAELTVSELREYVSKRLPHYMIPAYFVSLESIPLSSSGKVDRKALPEPTVGSGAAYVEAGTGLEKKIAAAWKEILGIEKIGIYDKFFDIGGNSLNILQVHSKIKEMIKKDFPVMVMFRYPTIYLLAGYLGQEENDTGILQTEEKKAGLLNEARQMMTQTLKRLGTG